jgi:putative membrane protein
MKMLRLIVRFIISALVLLVLSFILPGFAVVGLAAPCWRRWSSPFWAISWKPSWVTGSPQSRGIVGFIVAAIVIYVAQFFVPAMTVSILGAALAAIVIGIVDAFVPTELR